MLEKDIQKKIIKALEKRGCWVVKTISSNKNGTPDIIACCDGRFYAVEVKQPGKKATKIQDFQLKKIQEAGGIAFVASSVEDLLT